MKSYETQSHEPQHSDTEPILQPSEHEEDESVHSSSREIDVPESVAGSGSLDLLVETARDYASKATADNTNLAYQKDWAHFASWCRRGGCEPLSGNPCPDPQIIGLYITELASPLSGSPPRPVKPLAVSTIERKLSGLSWNYQQRGFILDRQDRHIGVCSGWGRNPTLRRTAFSVPIEPIGILIL